MLLSRQRNFTLALEGATTEEAIAAERRAAFEAAETQRLQVPACCCLAQSNFKKLHTPISQGKQQVPCCCPLLMHCVSRCVHMVSGLLHPQHCAVQRLG